MHRPPIASPVVNRVVVATTRIVVAVVVAVVATAASAQGVVGQRLPLNPQPLPPRSSAQAVDVARPATGTTTGIIIVGGRPATAAPETMPKKSDAIPRR